MKGFNRVGTFAYLDRVDLQWDVPLILAYSAVYRHPERLQGLTVRRTQRASLRVLPELAFELLCFTCLSTIPNQPNILDFQPSFKGYFDSYPL
jgi:hypothetical protein